MDSDGEDNHELTYQERFERKMQRVRNNDPRVKSLWWGDSSTNREWEEIGRDISNNTYLERLDFGTDALTLDDETFSSIFRGLSGSSSIITLDLSCNYIIAAGLRSVESFVQNSINLRELDVSYNSIETDGFNFLMQILRGSPIESLECISCGITSIEIESVPTNLRLLDLHGNHIQSEGFNRLLRLLRDSSIEHLDCNNSGITSIEIETVPNNLRFLELSRNNVESEGFNRLLRSLRDSSIEDLRCNNCYIESIDIVTDSFPRKLKVLELKDNKINPNGCQEIAKLLQAGGIMLENLYLGRNLIGDEGVAVLVGALKTNKSLRSLHLDDGGIISDNGRLQMLKLLNDMSSIKATLQSNHTLQYIGGMHRGIGSYFSEALKINQACSKCPEAAGREKVIQTQLHSQRRAKLAEIQGVQHSLYGEIDPLHLPEVLSLVGHEHGQEELYVALKVSIAEVMSKVNRKRCIQQRIADHESVIAKHESVIAERRAKQSELREEIASMEEEQYALAEHRSTKRQRK